MAGPRQRESGACTCVSARVCVHTRVCMRVCLGVITCVLVCVRFCACGLKDGSTDGQAFSSSGKAASKKTIVCEHVTTNIV